MSDIEQQEPESGSVLICLARGRQKFARFRVSPCGPNPLGRFTPSRTGCTARDGFTKTYWPSSLTARFKARTTNFLSVMRFSAAHTFIFQYSSSGKSRKFRGLFLADDSLCFIVTPVDYYTNVT